MAYDHPDRVRFSELTFCTMWNVEKYVLTWTLERFSWCRLVSQQSGQGLRSPAFHAGSKDKIKWCLTVYPNGDPSLKGSSVGCFLTLLEKDEKTVFVKCSFYGMDGIRNTLFHEDAKFVYENTGEFGIYKTFSDGDMELIRGDDVFMLMVRLESCSGPDTDYDCIRPITPKDDDDDDESEDKESD